jgi:hypothetical protein
VAEKNAVLLVVVVVVMVMMHQRELDAVYVQFWNDLIKCVLIAL